MGVLFLAAVGVVLAVTGAADTRRVEDFAPAPGAVGFLQQVFDPRRFADMVTTLPADGEQCGNVALFLPVGLFAQAFWRRTVWSIGFCLLLSIVIEVWQSYVGRSADLVDVRNNAVGGILGVICFLAVGSAARGRARRVLERAHIERLTAVTAAAVAVLLAFVVSQQGYHNAPPQEEILLGDPKVPDHELLDSVLAIVAARAGGDPQFSYVPQRPRPAFGV